MNGKEYQQISLDLPDADIIYYPDFFSNSEADRIYQHLLKATPWQQDHLKIYGKVHEQPRLTALFGEKTLSYSGITMIAHEWTDEILQIKKAMNAICPAHFNSVLLNYYRDGKDSNGWHADNEKYLGQNPVIASVTFGEARPFHLKHNVLAIPTQKLLLGHGSVLIMQGVTQHFWKHQIPKTKKQVNSRINLTFRVVL